MNKKLFFIIALLFSQKAAFAAGPESIALADRSLWPEEINSSNSFDRASRGEILAFAEGLDAVTKLDDTTVKNRLKIKQVNRSSITHVAALLKKRLFDNWTLASKSCSAEELLCGAIENSEELTTKAKKLLDLLPENYGQWRKNANDFHTRYAEELVRLAALFPAISSEIDTFSSNEKTGVELSDKNFLLTFDDGPTAPKGTTDTLIPLLEASGIHATFYLLGKNLKTRISQTSEAAVTDLYGDQCVASHGWEHQSHAKWSKWQESVLTTKALLSSVVSKQYRPWFRPPYGQRTSDSESFFIKEGLGVALWNIDSQDWNAHLSGPDAGNRVFTLMLLWRRGVILFHDIHPKAHVAVPWLIENSQKLGIKWVDCREY